MSSHKVDNHSLSSWLEIFKVRELIPKYSANPSNEKIGLLHAQFISHKLRRLMLLNTQLFYQNTCIVLDQLLYQQTFNLACHKNVSF